MPGNFSQWISRRRGEGKKGKYPSNERSNGNTIPWTKGRKDVKRVVCPEKTRLFIIETSRVGISEGNLFNRKAR